MGGPSPNHEFHEFDSDDPMVQLFRSPNKWDTQYSLFSYIILFHLLCGYVPVWVIRDDFGMPRELWPIPTHWVQRLSVDTEGQPLNFVVQSPWGQRIDVPFDQCVVFQEFSPLNRHEGYAVSIAIAEWLDTYESLIRVRLAQFKNGAVPNIHVSLGESYSDPDEAFLARFYAKWFARFQGENMAGLPLITGPDIEVKPIGSVPYELFQTEEEGIRTEVLAAFGVPQALVTGDPTVDTSAYAPKRTFAEFRINPMMKYYGETLTYKLIRRTKGYENALMFWPDFRPEDPQHELNKWFGLLDRGAASPNDVRVAMHLNPFPHGGDDPILNGAPVPWVTGRKQEQDEELEQEFRRQVNQDMGESVGALGGYLTRQHQIRHILANGVK
jgi:hypothetical protein